MATSDFATAVHLPFPSRRDYKSLETDGLAVARLATAGDASGGNVLHTFRGQAGFLYVLRAISAESDEAGGVNANPDVEIRLDAQWIADAANLTQGDFYSILSMANSAATGAVERRVSLPNFSGLLVEHYRSVFLGKIVRTGVFDLMAMSHRENINGNNYISLVLFDLYRSEALTVPGIMDSLRLGLIR